MSAPNPSTALARVVVDELARNGVRHVVLAPGSRSAALAMAAWDHPGLRVHVEVDERSAGFLALGIGKASGMPAAAVTTSGTAAVNLHPAVVEADLSRTPLLLLTADRPPELRHVGANQTIDQIGLFGTSVRWFCEVGVAEDTASSNAYWRSTVCRAVVESVGRAGPVHLNLAFREPLVPLTDDGRASVRPFASDLEGRAGGEPWTRLVEPPEPIAAGDPGPAHRPLVVVGEPGIVSVQALLEAGVPVIAEAPSGARVAGTITAGHHLLGHPRFLAAHLPDLVVTVGRVGLSPHLSKLVRAADRHVAVAPAGWPDPLRSASLLLRRLDPSCLTGDEGWLERWRRADRVARDAIDAAIDARSEPTEPRVARDLGGGLPPGVALVAASSMPVRDLDWYMPAAPRRVIANRGASGIDGFVSTALGVAIATDGAVVALAGDLSLLHDASGFLLSDRPDCVFVAVNNDGGGIFSFLPQSRFPEQFEPLFGTPHGRDLRLLAGLHGLGYWQVEAAKALLPAVEEAASLGGVHLVEVRTDRAANVEVHREIGAAVADALDGILG